MTEFRLFNTMTRSIEPFAPADGDTVRIYSCGPTVYNPAHLGNFRTFLFADLLRRTLRLRGWKVRQVMNLTDVDDKIIRRAHEQKKTIREVTEPVTAIFHEDREYLRIEPAEEYPKATDYIPQMIALVETLIERKVAYVAEDNSVYFAIDRFPSYGKLSRLDTREVRAGARVAQDDYSKENAQDFALWKSAKPEDEASGAAWDSPWGRGRPGLAPRVLGHGDRSVGRDARHSLRRNRSDLSAPRGRDRAVGGGDGPDLFALLVPWRVPADRRHQDGEAVWAT